MNSDLCQGTTKKGVPCKFKCTSPCGCHCKRHCKCELRSINCGVCYEDTTSIRKLGCDHELCTGCAKRWLQSHSTCPFCRADIPGNRITHPERPTTPDPPPEFTQPYFHAWEDMELEMEMEIFQIVMFQSVLER